MLDIWVEFPDGEYFRTTWVSRDPVAGIVLHIGKTPRGWSVYHRSFRSNHGLPLIPVPWFETWQEAAVYARFLTATWMKSEGGT